MPMAKQRLRTSGIVRPSIKDRATCGPQAQPGPNGIRWQGSIRAGVHRDSLCPLPLHLGGLGHMLARRAGPHSALWLPGPHLNCPSRSGLGHSGLMGHQVGAAPPRLPTWRCPTEGARPDSADKPPCPLCPRGSLGRVEQPGALPALLTREIARFKATAAALSGNSSCTFFENSGVHARSAPFLPRPAP